MWKVGKSLIKPSPVCLTTFSPKTKCNFSRNLSSAAASTTSPIKLSYRHGVSNSPMSYDTVGSSLRSTVEKFPDREALVFCDTDTRRTFSQFWVEVEKFAAGLIKLGFKKGDLVGIWGVSSLEWAITQFATSLVGIVLVNVNPAYQVNEMEYALNLTGCKGIVAATPFKTQDYYGMLKKACPELETSDPGRLRSARFEKLSHVIMMGDDHLPGTFRFKDVMDMSTPSLVGEAHNQLDSLFFDDAINVQFTSGTTGFPKGATLTHHNIINNAKYVGETAGYHQNHHRICCQVPLYHCFGMVAGLLCAAVHGCANIFPTAGYDPQATVRSLVNENVTMVYGTPTMFVDACSIVESNNIDLPHLQKGVIAGSPCAVELVKKAEQVLGIFLHIAYGSTETSPVVCCTREDDPLDKRITSVGRTISHTENMIVNSEGVAVPTGVTGELCSRGYCVMLKYWNDEKKTSSAIKGNHWYHTGDLAVMDDEGFISITGRVKDMVIRGGENVYPTEIENLLHGHPMIDDAQVFGVPDARLGEEIAVWIRLKEGKQLNEKEVKEFCKGKLAHFKIPKYVKFVEEYPLTVTRKVQKHKMRDLYAEELGLSS